MSLRAALPPEVQATLLGHETAGTTSSPDYAKAVRFFYDRHVCRVPWPPEVERTFAAIEADPTVYHTMNGPSEFHVVGSLKSWSIIDRLDRVQAPTLLISGRYDEATRATVQPYADRIPDVRWTIFENSSHMPHVEETERCLRVVGEFSLPTTMSGDGRSSGPARPSRRIRRRPAAMTDMPTSGGTGPGIGWWAISRAARRRW